MRKRIISIVLIIGLLIGTWDMTAMAKEAQTEQTAVKVMTAQAASYAQMNTSNMYAIANYGVKQKTGSYLLLKVPGNKNGRVMPMTVSTEDHSTGELYTLAKVGKWYTVTPKCAGSWRLNVEGEKSNINTDVGLWSNTNHSTQGWYFEPVSGVKDGYVIRSANNTDCVLDIRGYTKGSKVKINKYNKNNKNQIWIVRAYPASISLNKTSATLDIGKTVTLSANRKPVDMPVAYSSSASKVATVNSKGVVTAKAAGTATISAKCCGKTATCKITVRKSTLSVNSKLAKTSNKGNYKKISYKVTPVKQCYELDCGIASMATCELYNEQKKKGAYKNLISKHKKNKARLDAMRAVNAKRAKKEGYGPDWSYFSLIKYDYKKVSNSSIYSALKKGPVIVRKCRYNSKGKLVSSHYSVVYEYSGSKSKLENKGFKMIEVRNGKKTNLSSWLNGGVNGKGKLVQVIGKK